MPRDDSNERRERIAAAFEKLLDAWSKRALEGLVPNRASCEAYSSERQIVDLIAALDGTLSSRGLTAGVSVAQRLQ